MSLQWTNHDEHERLRVAAQRELQQIRQLVQVSIVQIPYGEHRRRL